MYHFIRKHDRFLNKISVVYDCNDNDFLLELRTETYKGA